MAFFKRPSELHSAHRPKSRFGCWFFGLLICFGLPLFAVFIVVLMITIRERQANQVLRERLLQRQQQGLPSDNESVEAFYHQLTSEQNTEAWMKLLQELQSDAYTQGYVALDLNFGEENTAPVPGEEWGQQTAVREFLDTWKNTHRTLQQLCFQQLDQQALPVRFPIEFQSLNTLLKPVQDMREAARLLQLRGKVAIYDRDSAGVHRAIISLLGCADAVSGQPIFVSSLVAIAIDGMAMNLLKSALEHDMLEERHLVELLALMRSRLNISSKWKAAIEGEIALVLPVFDDPTALGSEMPLTLPARSRDKLVYLDHMEDVAELSTADIYEFSVAVERLDQEFGRNLNTGWVQRFDSLMTGLLAPSIGAIGNAFIRQAAQHRIATLAIGLRLHEKREGAFPASLQELKLLDLDFNQLTSPVNQPFGYSNDGQGAVLWGADFQREKSIPHSPPSTDPADPYSANNEIWIWNLP